MTRKDYILIARALQQARERERIALKGRPADYLTWTTHGQVVVATTIADALGLDNPRFNRDHFLAVVRGEKALESRPPRGARV